MHFLHKGARAGRDGSVAEQHRQSKDVNVVLNGSLVLLIFLAHHWVKGARAVTIEVIVATRGGGDNHIKDPLCDSEPCRVPCVDGRDGKRDARPRIVANVFGIIQRFVIPIGSYPHAVRREREPVCHDWIIVPLLNAG